MKEALRRRLHKELWALAIGLCVGFVLFMVIPHMVSL